MSPREQMLTITHLADAALSVPGVREVERCEWAGPRTIELVYVGDADPRVVFDALNHAQGRSLRPPGVGLRVGRYTPGVLCRAVDTGSDCG